MGPSICGTELQRLGDEIFGVGAELVVGKCAVTMKITLDFHGVLLSWGGIKQGI